MLTDPSFDHVLSRAPDLVDLLNDVPNVHSRLRRIYGPHAEPTWNTEDRAYMTILLVAAGLVENLRALSDRIDSLKADHAAIESKAELARAAEMDWRPTASARDGIVFTNGVGEVVTLPRDFLGVFAAKRQLDVSEIVREGGDVVIRDGERVIAKMPASLWVVLEKVIVSCPWISGSR